MAKILITHYWTIFKASDPPCVTMKLIDGRCIMVFLTGPGVLESVDGDANFCREPQPRTHADGRVVGEWRDVGELRERLLTGDI